MPYRILLKRLMDQHIVTGCIILDPYGNIFYHAGAFPQAGEKNLVDGYYLLSEWVTFPSSIRKDEDPIEIQKEIAKMGELFG